HESGRRGDPVLPDGVDMRVLRLAEMVATLHPAWAGEDTFLRGDKGQAGWCQAELLRVRGERFRGRESKAAEALFLHSIEQARQDGTLAWELRTSTSLARLWMADGRRREAWTLLRSTLDKFTEGYSTRDVKEATDLHDMLAGTIATSRTAFP